jgi:predicted nicotinamide N-methyase
LRIIELGCGVGVVGLTLARSTPCSVLLTDLAEVEEILMCNTNMTDLTKIQSVVEFLPLNWEQSLPQPLYRKPFDMIIVADCTYNPDSSPALVNTVAKLCQNSPNAFVIVAMKVRHESENVFFSLMDDIGFSMQGSHTLWISTFGNETDIIETYAFRLFNSNKSKDT